MTTTSARPPATTCATAQLRSTRPTWPAATQVTGEPAPKVAGAAETFTVTGLTGGTFYYFALKVTDDAANTSEISNVTYAFASTLGEKVLQDGLGGYGGCSDNYMEAGSPTIGYGDRERMRICGYRRQRPTNRQRAWSSSTSRRSRPVRSITSATLSLYAYDETARKGSTGFYGAYPLTRDWHEIGSTWNNAATRRRPGPRRAAISPPPPTPSRPSRASSTSGTRST